MVALTKDYEKTELAVVVVSLLASASCRSSGHGGYCCFSWRIWSRTLNGSCRSVVVVAVVVIVVVVVASCRALHIFPAFFDNYHIGNMAILDL